MEVPRSHLVDQRSARKIGIQRGSPGAFDESDIHRTRKGFTPDERASYDYRHDLTARDGFNGFAPGVWSEVQAQMIASMFAVVAASFAAWKAARAAGKPSPLPSAPYVAPRVKAGALRAARGARRAMIDGAEREDIGGVMLTRLPTGGRREQRITR